MSATVVVGGAHGIGRAVAERLSQSSHGIRLVIADIDGATAEEVATGLRSASVDAVAIKVDVADPISVASLLATTPDAERVVIAAGIFASAPTRTAPLEQFEHVLRVNLIGCFHVAQAYADQMCENGGGSIVAVASIAARMPRMWQAAYCASKAGLRQSLRVLAMEVAGDGVRINTVSPGPTDTEMMREMARDHTAITDLANGNLKVFRPRVPNGRVADVLDIASAVEFLLSRDSGHIIMSDLVVDGGELLGM
jgi:2,3-dihydro-2,3-dihydroxybenzoate dehydrogenase